MSVAEYSVEVEGLEELQERLERYPQIARAVLVPTMHRVVITGADNVQGFTPRYQSRLANAIGGKVQAIGGHVQGIISASGIAYAVDMEIGPPAGRWPNMKALKRWAHLVLRDEEAAPAVALALYEGRSRVQLRPYAMFARGWVKTRSWASEQFRKARDEIVRRLAGGR